MRLTGTYVFYADVYFLQNLLLKVTVLYLALYVNKQSLRVDPIKILLAGIFGTILEILGLIWGQNFSFFVGLVNLVEIPVIMFYLLHREWKMWLHVTVSAWFFVLVVNGVVEAVFNFFGETGHFIEMVLLACVIVWVGTKQFLQYRNIQKGIYPTEIYHKGIKIMCRGLYDSGNGLKDPYTGSGVHIISRKVWEKLKLEDENPVLIPFTSLGNQNDLMKVYYVEKVIIHGRNEAAEQSKVAVGVAEDHLFDEKTYDVILNENVW